MGGSERQMVELARRLDRATFAPQFVLLRERGILAGRAEAAGVPVRVLELVRPSRSVTRAGPGIARSGRAVQRYLRWTWGQVDVVDAWLYHAYVFAALARPLTRVPVLVSGRRSLSDFKDGFGPAQRRLDAFARRQSDAFVANSSLVRDDIVQREGLAPELIRVIHNGVDRPPPMSNAERRRLRAGWGAGDDEVVVACVANYKVLKGLESLIRVATRLRDRHPAFRLVLVGEGPLRSALTRMIDETGLAGHVVLNGLVPDATAIYGAFDVAVQASETEGLPNVLLEAAAAGLPIVATGAGGTAEIVIDGSTGLIVPVADEAALAAALDRLLGDETLRRRFGKAAADDVLERFGFERLVSQTERLYSELYVAARDRRRRR